MPSHVPFTNNFRDLSTDKGFQFKFCCERCGNGTLSAFQPNALGMASGALQAVNILLGGRWQRAATSTYDVQRLIAGPAHDAALRTAVTEVTPQFSQCNRCGKWVCRKICWNGERNQCASCSPKMDQELAAMESAGTVSQLNRKIYDGTIDLTTGVKLDSAAAGQRSVAAARQCACGAQMSQGAKFCPDCGAKVALKNACSNCGIESNIGAKFCADCGHGINP